MPTLGSYQGLEADVSSQEQEEEEKEAVWLREQGHCKMRSVRDHPSQDSTTGCSRNRPESCQDCAGTWEEELRVFSGRTSGFIWVAGQGRGGCGSRQP